MATELEVRRQLTNLEAKTQGLETKLWKPVPCLQRGSGSREFPGWCADKPFHQLAHGPMTTGLVDAWAALLGLQTWAR
jgi:hypothetical protein